MPMNFNFVKWEMVHSSSSMIIKRSNSDNIHNVMPTYETAKEFLNPFGQIFTEQEKVEIEKLMTTFTPPSLMILEVLGIVF